MQDQNQQLLRYIMQMRQAGQLDEVTRQQLLSHGWPYQTIAMLLPAPEMQQQKSGSKLKMLLPILLAVVIAGGGAAYFFLKPDKSGPTNSNQAVQSEDAIAADKEFALFTDPNFSIDLPKSWSGDAGYEPGKELTFFYSPEDANDANRTKAARMTIYATEGDYDRITAQLEGVTQAGGTYETVKDETVKFGDYDGRLVEVVVSSKEQPDTKTHLMSLQVKGKQKQYYVDLSSLDESWKLHAANADKIMKSFKPLN